MKFCLYLDESGDHGLTQINSGFPVFLLCGILLSETDYPALRDNINAIKNEFWGNKHVIFHSRDIRKCNNEFAILFDLDVKERFYERINNLISQNNYVVIASAIQKDEYIKRYGLLSSGVYEIALSFIIERAIFFLDDVRASGKELEIIIEKRGKKEDKQLEEHFQRLLSRGTRYVNAERLKTYNLSIIFKGKKENINGLQLSDLIAYPIATYVIDMKRVNLAFKIIAGKIYTKNGKMYGLKVFP